MTNPTTVELADLLRWRTWRERQPTRHNHSLSMGSHHPSRRHSRGIDFDHTRTYQAGDDVRFIDWRVTARLGKLHTKLYHQDNSQPIFVIVDYSPSLFFATRRAYKSVIAANTAAKYLWQATNAGNPAGLWIHHEQPLYFAPQSNNKKILPMLKGLVTQHTVGKVPASHWYEALPNIAKLTPSGSKIIVLTDGYHLPPEDFFRHYSKKYHWHLGFIYDPLEAQLPPPNIYQVSDGEAYAWLDTNSAKTRERFNDFWQARYNNLKQWCCQHAVFLDEICTANA